MRFPTYVVRVLYECQTLMRAGHSDMANARDVPASLVVN